MGELRFSGLTQWPVTLRAPGIMGWYAWMPFMECYYGVVSLDHAICGSLQVDRVVIDLSGGGGTRRRTGGAGSPPPGCGSRATIWTSRTPASPPPWP